MSVLVLLVALAFSSFCHHWSAGASVITCEAVRREGSAAEPSCQPVEDNSVHTPSVSCASSAESDGAKVVYNNETRSYRIIGLPNFSTNGSYIGYCPSDPTDGAQGGCVAPKNIGRYHVKNLSIKYSPVGMNLYKATMTWTYYLDDPTPVNPRGEDIGIKAYRLWVRAPGINFPGYCVCINSTINLREYSLILGYNRVNVSEQLNASVFTFPYELHPNQYQYVERHVLKITPDNCADYNSGLPYNSATCNIPYYGKPRNVKVDRNATHTTLSWDKPCYQDPDACHLLTIDESPSPHSAPGTYYLTATVNGVSSYFVIRNTTEVTLSTPGPVDFKLYTHTPCSGVCDEPRFENCSKPAVSVEPDDGTCCTSISPSPTPTISSVSMSPTNTIDDPGSHQSSYLSIYLPVCMVVVLCAVVIVVLLLVTLWHKHRTCGHSPPTPYIPPTPPLSPCPVLVVFSPRTRELETHTILQCLVSDLTASSYGIESSTYGMSQLRQNQSEWISERHRNAYAVLCVCNQEFFEDWTSTFPDSNPQVVRTLKLLFEGDMQRGACGTDNYAVIKMKPTDDQFIPPLLKHRPVYMYHEVERIARFAHNVPQYCL